MLPIKPQKPLNLISPFLLLNLAQRGTAQLSTEQIRESSAISGKQTTRELFKIRVPSCSTISALCLFVLDVYPHVSRSGKYLVEMDFSSHMASESIQTGHMWFRFYLSDLISYKLKDSKATHNNLKSDRKMLKLKGALKRLKRDKRVTVLALGS